MDLQERINEVINDPRFIRAMVEEIVHSDNSPLWMKTAMDSLTDDQKIQVVKNAFAEYPKDELEGLFEKAFERFDK